MRHKRCAAGEKRIVSEECSVDVGESEITEEQDELIFLIQEPPERLGAGIARYILNLDVRDGSARESRKRDSRFPDGHLASRDPVLGVQDWVVVAIMADAEVAIQSVENHIGCSFFELDELLTLLPHQTYTRFLTVKHVPKRTDIECQIGGMYRRRNVHKRCLPSEVLDEGSAFTWLRPESIDDVTRPGNQLLQICPFRLYGNPAGIRCRGVTAVGSAHGVGLWDEAAGARHCNSIFEIIRLQCFRPQREPGGGHGAKTQLFKDSGLLGDRRLHAPSSELL